MKNCFRFFSVPFWAFLVGQAMKNIPAMPETQVLSLSWKDSLRREWLPTSVFLPGEFHGQKSPVGYSPWGHKGSDKVSDSQFHFQLLFNLPYHPFTLIRDYQEILNFLCMCVCVWKKIERRKRNVHIYVNIGISQKLHMN